MPRRDAQAGPEAVAFQADKPDFPTLLTSRRKVRCDMHQIAGTHKGRLPVTTARD